MTKDDAINLLGRNQQEAADRLGVSSAAISMWPEELPLITALRVFGAARLWRKPVPRWVIIQLQKQVEEKKG